MNKYTVITHGPVIDVMADSYEVKDGILFMLVNGERVAAFNSWLMIKKETLADKLVETKVVQASTP